MRLHAFFIASMVTTGAIVFTGCSRVPASGPHAPDPTAVHDHAGAGDHPALAAEELDPISVTLFSPNVELFMEYPHLIQGEKAVFLAHVTVLSSGEPVRSGSLMLEAKGGDGRVVSVQVDAPARDGLFKPEAVFPAAGSYAARLTLHSDQADETIDLGNLVVHPDAHEAAHAAEATAADDPPDAIPFLLEQQWKIGMLLTRVSKRTLSERLRVPAEILATQGSSAAVSPPMPGRLVRAGQRRLPRIGEMVAAGEVLAWIEPPLPVSSELTLRALDLEIKAIEIERTTAESRQRLEFAQRAYDRAVAIRDQGVGTEVQFDEAHRTLELARIEADGALAMKRYYENATAKLNELRGRGASPGETTNNTAALRMPLVSPIAGRIEKAAHVEGEHIDAHQEVFRVLNAEQVSVEGRISEFDLSRLSARAEAYMTLPAVPDRRIHLPGAAGGELVALGQVVDPASRTVPIRYELPNPDRLLRIGMLADLFLETGRAAEALAIPEQALVMERGHPTAYVLLHGELFQKRELELGLRDGGYVEVKNGLADGDRVVTKGAYAVRIAALSPASFSHGHDH